MTQGMLIGLIVFLITGITIDGVMIAGYADNESKYQGMWNTPRGLHHNTNMNWVGSIICSIVLMSLFPITSICKIIWFLFHI